MAKKKTKKPGAEKRKSSEPRPAKRQLVAPHKKTLLLSFAEMAESIHASLKVKAAAASATKAVTFTNNNANVLVDITTAGQNDVTTCTLNLSIGIYPLDYRAQGAGDFNVSVSGAEVAQPIAGTAPDAGTTLIKVS